MVIFFPLRVPASPATNVYCHILLPILSTNRDLLASCSCAVLLTAVPSKLVAVHRYIPASVLRTFLRANVEVPPSEVTTASEEEVRGLAPMLQVKVGRGWPLAEQEKLAVPPSGVTISAGCWVMEGGKGWTAQGGDGMEFEL